MSKSANVFVESKICVEFANVYYRPFQLYETLELLKKYPIADVFLFGTDFEFIQRQICNSNEYIICTLYTQLAQHFVSTFEILSMTVSFQNFMFFYKTY